MINKFLIKQHEDKFDSTMMFGIPISKLNADELRACICVLGKIEMQSREGREREREMFKLFRKRKA